MLIYCITNLLSGKKYVGQTVQTIEKRFSRHCWNSTLQRAAMPISLAIKKYGKENFKIELLCECFTQEELNEMEIYHTINIGTFCPSGYNLRAGSGKGFLSEETKKKIGDANRGSRRSEDAKKNMSNAHKGIKLSEEHKVSLKKALTASNKSRAKTYKFVSPIGDIVEFTNMNEFCGIHGLSACNMYRIIRGDRDNYKGWKVYK